ncbi:MAG: prenyltransferase/squalene oxidase repeat-containing protein [Planctomycetota bacterium]
MKNAIRLAALCCLSFSCCTVSAQTDEDAGGAATVGGENVSVIQEQSLQEEINEQNLPRPDFMDNIHDFSQAPEIPEIPGPSASEIQTAIDNGVKFLVRTQNADGSFGSHVSKRTGEIYAPMPGSHHAFRGATTALSVSAMLETRSDDPEVQESILAAQNWMLETYPRIRRAQGDTIYNVWAHAYGIQALVRLFNYNDGNDEIQQQIVEMIDLQVDMLVRYESIDGGWGYYDFVAQGAQPTGASISFVNATVLIAFAEARDIGIEIPERLVTRAVDSIHRQQKPDFSYLYGEYLKDRPMRGINNPGGSLARSQACNLSLRLWGDEEITDNVLKIWLYRLYLRNGWLDMGRKRPVPHESWMQVAGYFYYYGHYYAGLCIDQLQPEDQDEYRNLLAKILITHQEPNGCWWDYTLYSYHQQYGTAYAVMSLQRCIPSGTEPVEPETEESEAEDSDRR